ncbi:MAG: heparinase II/III family protein, partial [Lentisphaerae bacterium]|nr:heparinase II/III family protein [Lentisphaerota bacterium]
RNIEDRILRDALRNQHKIHSNYPRKDIAVAIIKTVLDWPANKAEIERLVDGMIKRSTSVDGVTGEKGLPGYAAYVIRAVATFLGDFDRIDPAFLENTFERHPALQKTYRFHIDTWCMQTYYPLIGDAWYFAGKMPMYQGVLFVHPWSPEKNRYHVRSLRPSPYTFLWKLYEHTGDTAFAQVMYHANGNSVAGVPHDLFVNNPERIQDKLRSVIDREGAGIKLGSVNKEQWHVAILRSGEGENARAAWLHYEVGGGHHHQDGMNLGLFARGLDLMPDFGYPPVQFGGWNSPRADWYRNTVSHNTVVVDGRNHAGGAGTTTLWSEGELLSGVRVSCPQMIGGKRFERTVAMVNVSDGDAYLLDVFRVAGGKDHEKYMGSHFGTIETEGFTLEPSPDHMPGTQMRNFRKDPSPEPGWSVTWNVEDKYNYLPPGTPVHLRYTDLTRDAEAYACEAWIVKGTYESGEEDWVHRIKVRRSDPQGDLESTFVAVIEPYGATSNIKQIRRLPVTDAKGTELSDLFVAVEIRLVNGDRDLLVSGFAEPGGKAPVLKVADWDLETDAELCVVRKDGVGTVKHAMICKGSFVRSGTWREERKEVETWEFKQ